MRIPYYVQSLVDGEMVSQAKLEIEQESRLARCCQWKLVGVGQVQAMALLDVVKARRCQRLEWLLGNHASIGAHWRLGEYCEWAAERGWVSMFMVNHMEG